MLARQAKILHSTDHTHHKTRGLRPDTACLIRGNGNDREFYTY